ncbi:hypothetical protein NPIL_571381 [Nephila pilipes]|uniref:Uncharacterized protein n=1 Tax=Nephila pilipes TaxID=299642 RepID=A0A8X6R3Q5_NEPPI|nr:hypothetical protein NPIL_571381 [Nephila pilipes]
MILEFWSKVSFWMTDAKQNITFKALVLFLTKTLLGCLLDLRNSRLRSSALRSLLESSLGLPYLPVTMPPLGDRSPLVIFRSNTV